jgi:hypothetical protein
MLGPMPRSLAVPLALLLVLALPAGASAVIVPQKGMRGIELGMDVAEVRAAAGSPSRFRTVRHPIIGPVREWRYGLTRVTFNATRADAEVISMTTTSRTERTAEGVGVGSTRDTVRRKVRGARCLVEFTYDHCFVGAFRPGRIVTDFAIDRRGRVARVTVGRVID